MARAQEDDLDRVKYVTDTYGKTSKASNNEYYVAKALDELGYAYSFQVSIAGGRTLAFGIVLDFLVETVPEYTPLYVHGEYWHSGEKRAKDLRDQETVNEYMGGEIMEPVEIWGDESDTESRALSAVRRKL
jgi:hypothetical protein